MVRKILNKTVIFMLSAIFLMGAFAGCGKGDNGNENTSFHLETSSLTYSEDGEYEVKIDIDDATITKDDVVITAEVFDSEGFTNKFDSTEENNRDDIKSEDYNNTITPTITEVTNIDSVYSIKFSDKSKHKNEVNAYKFDIDKLGVKFYINVNEDKLSLTSDIEEVSYSQKEININLSLNKGEFEKEIKGKDVFLDGSFKNLVISEIRENGNNLFLKLTGDIYFDELAGIYTDGIITISENGIKGALSSVEIYIPVSTNFVAFDYSRLNFNDNIATIPLVISEVADPMTITKSDIVFEKDVTVHGLVNGKDEVILLLDINGATDENTSAEILNGQKIMIGDYKFYASVQKANFYPLFDSVKKSGENFNISLLLYGHSGKFKDGIKKEEVILNEGFEKGTVTGVTKQSETILKVDLTVPSNGQTVENMDIDGNITLKEGVLINEWDTPSEEVSYSRNYSQLSFGRKLTEIDLEAVKEIVGGFGNTTFGTISGIASGAVSAFNGVKTMLEIAGVLDSETVKIQKTINEARQEIVGILNSQTKMLDSISQSITHKAIANFNTKLYTLMDLCVTMDEYYAIAGKNAGLTIPSEDDSVSVWDEYYKNVQEQIVIEIKKAKETFNGAFRQFDNDFARLEQTYREICNSILATTSNQGNPLYIYDEMCAHTYNFNTIAYAPKLLYISNISHTIAKAFNHILTYRQYGKEGGDNCESARGTYTEVNAFINKHLEVIEKSKPGASSLIHLYDKNINVCNYGANIAYTPNWNYDPNSCFYEYKGYYKGIKFYHSRHSIFTDTQYYEFIKRLNGRTVKSEMESAGFTNMNEFPGGVAFNCFQYKRYYRCHRIAPNSSNGEMHYLLRDTEGRARGETVFFWVLP